MEQIEGHPKAWRLLTALANGSYEALGQFCLAVGADDGDLLLGQTRTRA